MRWLIAKDDNIQAIKGVKVVPQLRAMIEDLQEKWCDDEDFCTIIREGLIGLAVDEVKNAPNRGYRMAKWDDAVRAWKQGNPDFLLALCVTQKPNTKKHKYSYMSSPTPKPRPSKQPQSLTPPSPSPFTDDTSNTKKKKDQDLDAVFKMAENQKDQMDLQQKQSSSACVSNSAPNSPQKSPSKKTKFTHDVKTYIGCLAGKQNNVVIQVWDGFKIGMFHDASSLGCILITRVHDVCKQV